MPNDPMAAARRVLTVCQAALTGHGLQTPARSLVAPGADPAWECEQLTVQVLRPSIPGTTTQEQTQRGRPVPGYRYAEFRVELVREVPYGDGAEPPSVEESETAAAGLLADAAALEAGCTPKELSGRPGLDVFVGPMTLQGPLGGLASVAFTIAMPLTPPVAP